MTPLSLWGPCIAYMTLIYALSDQNRLIAPGGTAPLAHAVEYAILAGLLGRALAGGWRHFSGRAAVKAILLASAYGVSDEIHQSIVPGRTASADDVVMDVIGAAVGVLGWMYLSGARRSPRVAREEGVR